jgi:hypothetical protein
MEAVNRIGGMLEFLSEKTGEPSSEIHPRQPKPWTAKMVTPPLFSDPLPIVAPAG